MLSAANSRVVVAGRHVARGGMLLTLLALVVLLTADCSRRDRSRSERSFDEIADQVRGLDAGQIEALLGEPDTRRPIFLNQERWIWWNYTFLAGPDYPPEVRGRVVHLEITFHRTGQTEGASRGASTWRIVEPFGIAYRAAESGVELTGSARRNPGEPWF